MIPYSPTITTTRATTRDETPVPTTDAATFRPEANPEVPNGIASPVFSQGADPPRDVEALVGAVDDDDEGCYSSWHHYRWLTKWASEWAGDPPFCVGRSLSAYVISSREPQGGG